MNTDQLRNTKKEVKTLIENTNNDFIINDYFKGYDRFTKRMEILDKINLNNLTIQEIKLINYINKINKYDLEFMFKHL